MASVSSLGAGSGLDLQSLLENLMRVERQPLTTLNNKVGAQNATISALGTLNSKLSDLRTAAQNLKPATLQTPQEKFATYSSYLGDEKVGKVTVGDGAVTGKYSLEVISTAKGQKTTAAGLNSAGGSLSFSFADASRDFSVNVAAGASMDDVAKAINVKKGDVSATVVNGNLVLSGKEGVSHAFTMSSGMFASETQKQTASDAKIEVDGIPITSDSNKFTNALSGVTIDLSDDATIGTTTLSITKNSEDKLKSSLEAFVKAFNDANSNIRSQGSYDSETKKAGALNGNSILRETQSMLSKLVFNTKVSTTDASGNSTTLSLSAIGISFKATDGSLSIDADKFKAAIAANPDGVAKLAAEVGKQFDSELNTVIGVGGRIESSKNSLNATIKALEKQYETMETRIDAIEARYRAQFTALDTLVSKMNSTSSWLSQSLSSLQR